MKAWAHPAAVKKVVTGREMLRYDEPAGCGDNQRMTLDVLRKNVGVARGSGRRRQGDTPSARMPPTAAVRRFEPYKVSLQ